MSVLGGESKPPFGAVRDVLEEQFARGEHIGAGVSIYHRGEKVVDLWGGLADEDAGKPWAADTMAVSFSTTKGLTAVCLHMLADRGLVDYQAPVAAYWPEFAQHGKEKITVYHLLTHQAGMAPVPGTMHGADLYDWDNVIHAIEEQAPAWEPGAESGYHAMTFGYLVGEVIRRASGRTVGTFLRDEVCGPLGLQDMYIGAPPEVEPRIAKLKSKGSPTPEMIQQIQERLAAGEPLVDPLMERAFAAPPGGMFGQSQGDNPMDTYEAHRVEIPAANGVMTARDLARLYACLANGGELDGVRLMSAERVRTMSAVQTCREDKVLHTDIAWSLGFMNGGIEGRAQGPRASAFGHPGVGGSVGYCDPEIGLAFGFTTNALAMDGLATGRAAELAAVARTAAESAG